MKALRKIMRHSNSGNKRTQSKRARNRTIRVVSRIHLPEAAAASFRIHHLERAIVEHGDRLSVLTAQPPAGLSTHLAVSAGGKNDETDTTLVRVLRDEDGYVKGYASYLSFDLQALWHLLWGRKASINVVEPPPTTGVMVRLAGIIRRTPYVWYAADVWSDATAATGAHPLVVRAVRAFEQFTLRGAAGVIAVSDGVAQRVRELGAKNVAVIPNGADTQMFTTRAAERAGADFAPAAIGVRHPYYVYAGTASKWQGAEVLAEGFAEFWRNEAVRGQHRQCVFLARGESVERLRELAGELAALAAARGYDYQPLLVRDLVEPELAAAWQAQARAALVSIVPGQGYDFAYPTKILTALACGTPVLYAGPGPAATDISREHLGVAVAYDAPAVAHGLGVIESTNTQLLAPEELAQWVQEHRSMQETGRAAAAFVRSCVQH